MVTKCLHCGHLNRVLPEGGKNYCSRCLRDFPPQTQRAPDGPGPMFHATPPPSFAACEPNNPAPIEVSPRQAAVGAIGPSAVTIAFSYDVQQLIKFGVRIEKGATLAEGAGIGAGVAAAIGGHWAIGLAVAVVGAVAGEASRNYKQSRIEELRCKWVGVFNAMEGEELRMFASELQRYYPATLPALQSSLLGTTLTNRLLA